MRTLFIMVTVTLVMMTAGMRSSKPLAEKIELKEAVKKNLISVDAKAKGGSCGNVLIAEVRNLSGRPLDISLEAGTRFFPDNKGEQDLVVNGKQRFILPVQGKVDLDITGMCCIQENKVPSKDMHFSLSDGSMNSSMVLLARYIDQHRLYDSEAAQGAVWAVSGEASPWCGFNVLDEEGFSEITGSVPLFYRGSCFGGGWEHPRRVSVRAFYLDESEFREEVSSGYHFPCDDELTEQKVSKEYALLSINSVPAGAGHQPSTLSLLPQTKDNQEVAMRKRRMA